MAALDLNPLLSFTFMQTGNRRCTSFSMISLHQKPENTEKLQVLHSMPPHKIEVFKSMENWVEEELLVQLKPVEKCWQPQDFLPDPASDYDGFRDRVVDLRKRAEQIPDEHLAVLVGDMITEEAVLPTHQTALSFSAMRTADGTCSRPSAWAAWIKAWAAEENKHGDLLNKYLYLSGRVDMKQIQKTTQYLIGAGKDVWTENNPYIFLISTSFQERATFASHSNTARIAEQHGENNVLAEICGIIASDEKSHETAYTKIVEKLFEIDPDGAVVAFADMTRKRITMQGTVMYDGGDDDLFQHYAAAAQRLGVCTAKDYVDALEFFVERWNVEKLSALSGEGRRAQDYVCGSAQRLRRLEEEGALEKTMQATAIPFSWIFDRQVKLWPWKNN